MKQDSHVNSNQSKRDIIVDDILSELRNGERTIATLLGGINNSNSLAWG